MTMPRYLAPILVLALGATTPVHAQGAPAQTSAAPQLVASARPTGSDDARDEAIEKLSSFLSRYPSSTLRPGALFQLGELLVRRADENFATAQRAGGDVPDRPDYAPAIARYEELIQKFPAYPRVDAAAYTLGTLYFTQQRNADAVRMFELVTSKDQSHFRPEGFFRLGDADFELAAKLRGEPRKAMFVRAAQAYESATKIAPPSGDIYFLSLYKLGWSYYNQATQSNQPEYQQAVEVFGRLVAEYDKLSAEQQARLGLRGEAIEYMAVALTQTGGAEAARRYFGTHQASDFKLPVLRRVASGLRDQGDFVRAVDAYRAVLAESPADSSALGVQREIVDIYQNRVLEPDKAQAARLELVDRFAPGSVWANANAPLQRQCAGRTRIRASSERAVQPLARAGQGQEGQGKVRRGRRSLRALHDGVLEERQRAGRRSAVRRGALRGRRLLPSRHGVLARGVLRTRTIPSSRRRRDRTRSSPSIRRPCARRAIVRRRTRCSRWSTATWRHSRARMSRTMRSSRRASARPRRSVGM